MESFFILRHRAGYGSLEASSQLLGVSQKTVRVWDKTGAPPTAHRLTKASARDSEFSEAITP
jgi:predicted site-specific integrase-resolvase